jgi:tetratricopeptide (TPR) repeat protein
MNKTAENTPLDSDELLFLAIEASNQRDNEKSLRLLKQAFDAKPTDGRIAYMMGAIHAEIGMYDRAMADMQTAVRLDPNLDTAHFQLGLLAMTSGKVAEAEQAWQALDKLKGDHPLFLFKRGILSLATNQFEDCIRDLEKGIELNKANLPLNKDMRKLIERAKEAIKGNQTSSQKTPTANPSHVFLSAYKDEKQGD